MRAPALWLGLWLAIWGVYGCGSECGGICGSQCELIQCAHNRVNCRIFPGQAYLVDYLNMINDIDRTWTAQLTIDIEGLTLGQQVLLEGTEFTNRVHIARPGEGEQWPEFSGKNCKLDETGQKQGERLAGQCNFQFTNGRFASFNFSCSLEEVNP